MGYAPPKVVPSSWDPPRADRFPLCGIRLRLCGSLFAGLGRRNRSQLCGTEHKAKRQSRTEGLRVLCPKKEVSPPMSWSVIKDGAKMCHRKAGNSPSKSRCHRDLICQMRQPLAMSCEHTRRRSPSIQGMTARPCLDPSAFRAPAPARHTPHAGRTRSARLRGAAPRRCRSASCCRRSSTRSLPRLRPEDPAVHSRSQAFGSGRT